ncbi:MAG: DUF3450 domain-containing protein [Halioglobus sp.]
MTMHRLKNALIAALVSVGTLAGAAAAVQASTLDSILAVGEAKNDSARKSQVKIDRLADETGDLLTDYKTVTKQIDGLKVYNARLQRQIDNQMKRVGEIDQSISQVTVIQRQMTPLVIRMIDGLEQFVELDVPFEKEERLNRVAFLRANIDRADVSVAEKFRGVLEAYNIELQYGRGVDTYRGTIDMNGSSRDVDFLRIGRIALMYQTTDGVMSGAWDTSGGAWVELPSGEYDAAIRKGIRIAKKQATIELLNMPVSAPEAN